MRQFVFQVLKSETNTIPRNPGAPAQQLVFVERTDETIALMKEECGNCFDQKCKEIYDPILGRLVRIYVDTEQDVPTEYAGPAKIHAGKELYGSRSFSKMSQSSGSSMSVDSFVPASSVAAGSPLVEQATVKQEVSKVPTPIVAVKQEPNPVAVPSSTDTPTSPRAETAVPCKATVPLGVDTAIKVCASMCKSPNDEARQCMEFATVELLKLAATPERIEGVLRALVTLIGENDAVASILGKLVLDLLEAQCSK